MGAGKTAVGKAVAETLGVAFRDSDEAIVDAAQSSIAEIFERDGEAFFRAREAEVIERLLSEQPCILSTGGGAFMVDRNRQLMADKGVSVWLDADLELLWNRVKHKTTRPLLHTEDPRATLEQIYNARVPSYRRAALTVSADPEFSIAEMAARVIDTLATREDVLEVSHD